MMRLVYGDEAEPTAAVTEPRGGREEADVNDKQ